MQLKYRNNGYEPSLKCRLFCYEDLHADARNMKEVFEN